MKKISFTLILSILSALVLTSCGRKPSSPDTVLAEARDIYMTMSVRYERILQCTAMSQECLQELRVHGVHRESSWYQWFAWDSTKPLLRAKSILDSDARIISKSLYNMRKFGLENNAIYTKLRAIYEKLASIIEQLPVQKEYIDEFNTQKTHSMLAANQALLTSLYLKENKK